MSKPRDYKIEYENFQKLGKKQWKASLDIEYSKKLEDILERKQQCFSEWIRERIRLAK